MTQKARLVSFLVDNIKSPVSTAQINTVAGSEEGTRRVRELREEGFSINATREGRSWFYTLTRKPTKAMLAQYV